MSSAASWDQRVEAMRDTIVYFRNNPGIFFWEAGNTVVTPEQRSRCRSAQAVDPTADASSALARLQQRRQHRTTPSPSSTAS